MGETLDRLERLVARAEEQYSREKLRAELQELMQRMARASERHRAAQEALTAALQRKQEVKAASAEEEARLAALESRMDAFNAAGIDLGEAREVAAAAREEIRNRRTEAEERAQAAERELSEAEAALQDASAAVRRAREMSVRIHNEAPPAPSRETDAAAGEALAKLERELDALEASFGSWSREQQMARMKTWIGRLRRIQQRPLSDDDDRRARRMFPRLVGISKQYEPGYIEAFRQDFVTDWDFYVDAAQKQIERLEIERVGAEERAREAMRERQAREEQAERLEAARQRVRGMMTRDASDEEILSLVRELPTQAYGDEEIVLMLAPHAVLFQEGSEFRALRRNLQRLMESEDSAPAPQLEAAILRLTEGTKAVMVGGEVREPARRSLEAVFRFRELTWVPSAENEAQRLEARIANGSVAWVLLLRSFISHPVADKLVAACKSAGVPFLMIERGYGAARVAEAFRARAD